MNSPGTKHPSLSHPHTNRELHIAGQLLRSRTQRPVVIEALHPLDNQTLPYQRDLPQLAGGGFGVGPSRCPRERRRSVLLQVKRGKTLQFAESDLVGLRPVRSVLLAICAFSTLAGDRVRCDRCGQDHLRSRLPPAFGNLPTDTPIPLTSRHQLEAPVVAFRLYAALIVRADCTSQLATRDRLSAQSGW